MFLSKLVVNVGDDPTRYRPARQWLRNLYRVHQRLCMAFPTDAQRTKDPDFLMPYEPCGFPDPRPDRCVVRGPESPRRSCAVEAQERPIHVPRDTQHNFLFRIAPQRGGRVVILVQSAMKPDWEYAFGLIKDAVDDRGRPIGNAGFLLAALPEVKHFDPCFAEGQSLQFRLAANPTRKIDSKSAPDGTRRHGRRVPVPDDRLYEWLARRAESAGFSIAEASTTIQPGYVYVNKPWNGKLCDRCGKLMEEQEKEIVCKQCGFRVRPLRDRLRSVRYEGILKVTDPARFKETLIRGIGPGKAFGFGLLYLPSVAPVLLLCEIAELLRYEARAQPAKTSAA